MPNSSEYVNVPLRRIAIGSQDEYRQPGAFKAAVAEFISTLIFVFAGSGSSLAYSRFTNSAPDSPPGIIASALAHGLALFVAVAISSNISGGHVNPAVTLGLFVGGNITLFRGLLYIIAQLLGSLVAYLLLYFSSGFVAIPTFQLSGISVWSGLVFEAVMTFGLVYTVYATAVDPKKGEIGIVAPLAIGLIVAANTLAGGPFTGASMNPAVSFGATLLSMNWSNHWVYWAGPLIGGTLAGIIYEVFFISHTHEPVPDF